MLQIRYKKLLSEFHDPFTTAHGVKTHQPALLIALTLNGFTGIGEAPAIHYYGVSVESMIEELLEKTEILGSYSFTEPERFWHFCHHVFPDNSFLVCALDMAYWDLYTKIRKKAAWQLWGLEWTNIPLTDFTIGMDTPEVMLEKIAKHPAPIYKIKVGQATDLEILKKIREATNAGIRIDANASWTPGMAISMLDELEQMQIELIEQPFGKEDWEFHNELRSKTSIPVFADESCVSERDVKKCAPYFDGINIKLTKCGGLTPAYRMILEARKLGLKVMMGCMNETEPGSYAIAQFLPMLDYVDMDGPLLLKIPPLTRLQYQDGLVTLL